MWPSVVVTRAADAGATRRPLCSRAPAQWRWSRLRGAANATRVSTSSRTAGAQGVDAPALAKRVGKLLSDTWRCNRVVVQDRAGAGAGATRRRHLLQSALGRIPMQWAADDDRTESRMASDLVAAVNTRRLSLYPADCSPESRAIGTSSAQPLRSAPAMAARTSSSRRGTKGSSVASCSFRALQARLDRQPRTSRRQHSPS